MWFSTEKEIRNKEKKRTDFLPVSLPMNCAGSLQELTSNHLDQNELYITPSWDTNPLVTINGRAKVMSHAAFQEKYPTGKIPRNSPDFGKVFICRRGCNTRTATYTDEFVWEDIYHEEEENIDELVELVKNGTKATRRRRLAKDKSPDDYALEGDGDYDGQDKDKIERQRTPKRPRTYDALTPRKRANISKSGTPSHRK